MLGAEGAAFATTIVCWLMLFAITGYVLTRIDRARYGIVGRLSDAWGLGRRPRRLGYPMGLSHGLGTSAFSCMLLFAGLLGPTELAGYQVAMNLVALVFMCAIGFATAAGVRVANAVGRRDQEGLRRAGWIAVGLAAMILGGFGIIYGSVPHLLASLYTTDGAVGAVAISTIGIAAFVLVPDGAQGVLMGALRGAGDVWPATALYLLSFWLLMVPLGYVFGVTWAGGHPRL